MNLSCPLCDYDIPDSVDDVVALNEITYHIEVQHPEHESSEASSAPKLPSIKLSQLARPTKAIRTHEKPQACHRHLAEIVESDTLIDCPNECGESLRRSDLSLHTALHQAEEIALGELEICERELQNRGICWQAPKLLKSPHEVESCARSMRRPKILFCKSRPDSLDEDEQPSQGTETRLGRKELGPYAYEDRMPTWLFKQIEKGAPVVWVNQLCSDGRTRRIEKVMNETPGLISHLAHLCETDVKVSKAWLCSSGIKHIFKMHREGGFCGYRNIQMLVSWMQHRSYPGHEHFPGSTPNILRLQELIEDAWDKGFNACARAQTGGILGTRKFIGTPEAQALFQYLNIYCDTRAWAQERPRARLGPVHNKVLEQVLAYFSEGVREPSEKVYKTERPPLYFQHPGHSLTIVGLEIQRDSTVNLLVFDPMYATTSSLRRYGNSPSRSQSARILESFRRGNDYLERYRSFELLSLESLPAQEA